MTSKAESTLVGILRASSHPACLEAADELERLTARGDELAKQLGIGVHSQFTEGARYERELARLRAALEQCNEHRDDPHKIIGIVDAALVGIPAYDFKQRSDETSGEPACDHDLQHNVNTLRAFHDLSHGTSGYECRVCSKRWPVQPEETSDAD